MQLLKKHFQKLECARVESTSSVLLDAVQAETAAKLGPALHQHCRGAPGPITDEHVQRLLSRVQPRPPYEEYPQAQLDRLRQSGHGRGGKGAPKTCDRCSILTGGKVTKKKVVCTDKQVLKQKLDVAGAPKHHDCDYFAMRLWVYETWQRLATADWHNREPAA